MASDLKGKKRIIKRVSVRGAISDDCNSILYFDENKDIQEITIADLLNIFQGQFIDLSISLTDEEELDLNSPINDERGGDTND